MVDTKLYLGKLWKPRKRGSRRFWFAPHPHLATWIGIIIITKALPPESSSIFSFTFYNFGTLGSQNIMGSKKIRDLKNSGVPNFARGIWTMLPMFTMLAMLAMLPMLTMLTSKNKRNCTLQGGWVGVDNGIESVLEADCLTGCLPLYRWSLPVSCLAQSWVQGLTKSPV